ncbi:MAG: DUF4268 domain-containing protein [Candidatus Dormibacteria bacterium]
MPRDLLFTVSGNAATAARSITLAEAGLKERRDLQEWVIAHPEILGDDIKIVTFEFDKWLAAGVSPADRLDVLGLATDGRLVVAELKRDKAPDTVEMQAIKYAAMVSRFTPEALASQYARFLTGRGAKTSDEEAMAALAAHGGTLDVELLRRPRIVIVAGEYSPVVTASAVWLTEMGLDLTLVRVQAYATATETLIDVSQLFPVRDVEEFTVTPLQATVKEVEEKRERQKDISTSTRLVSSGILADGTEVFLQPTGINEELRGAVTKWVELEPDRGVAAWYNDAAAPLEWSADHQRYTPSGLAQKVLKEAANVVRSIRGGDWWVLDDERTLVQVANGLGSLRERLYVEFWTMFRDECARRHPEWIETRGQPSHLSWFDMASPIRGSHYDAAFSRNGQVKFELYADLGSVDKNKALIEGLKAHRGRIEQVFGGPLEWHAPGDGTRYGAIRVTGTGDVENRDTWPNTVEWFIDAGERLRAALEVAGVATAGAPGSL